MSEMAERLYLLRKHFCLTQQEFAKRINVVRTNIGRYESGACMPSGAVVELICREFNVSRRWLETGEGDMFQPLKRQEAIKQLADKIFEAPSDTLSAFVNAVTQLTESDLQVLSAFARALREGD